MRKRIWVMLAFFLVLGIVSFSVQSGPHCNTHRLQVNDQPILMYETPEEALSSMTESPLLPEVNRLSLSCKGGRPEHDIQLYLRLAKENDGTILTSPYATLYNFSPTQDEAAFAMNDVLDLDEASNYDLVLFELITYKKSGCTHVSICGFPLNVIFLKRTKRKRTGAPSSFASNGKNQKIP